MNLLFFLAAILDKDDIGIPKGDFNSDTVARALRLLFGLAGAIAFLLVTLAGLKYVLSQGNPQETAKAKNTIIDAMIGLIICVSAFAIISFFIGEL